MILNKVPFLPQRAKLRAYHRRLDAEIVRIKKRLGGHGLPHLYIVAYARFQDRLCPFLCHIAFSGNYKSALNSVKCQPRCEYWQKLRYGQAIVDAVRTLEVVY